MNFLAGASIHLGTVLPLDEVMPNIKPNIIQLLEGAHSIAISCRLIALCVIPTTFESLSSTVLKNSRFNGVDQFSSHGYT